MNKAVIFDLDGTLIDSVPDICENLNIMLKHFGYTEIDENRTREILGHGARQLVFDSVNRSVSDKRLEELLAYYNEIYTSSDSPKTREYDGITAMLKELKNRGYKLAVCTNKPQQTTAKVIELFFPKTFDCVMGQVSGVPLKPDKRAVTPILERLKVLPQNVYFVGDMETDYKVSVNLNCKSVLVLWGYGNREYLQSLGAKTFVNSTKELLQVIN